VDDVCEEGHGLFCPEVRDWACLDPLGEFVHDDQQVGVAPGRISQRPDDVQTPYGERPYDEYGLQGMSREIDFAGVKLAPFTGVHDLVGVSNRGGPKETLAECIAHEGVWLSMVKFHQPSHGFTFSVGMSFISYPLLLNPLV
jgi:hypothetical protein